MGIEELDERLNQLALRYCLPLQCIDEIKSIITAERHAVWQPIAAAIRQEPPQEHEDECHAHDCRRG